MAPLSKEWQDEFDRLRGERDLAFRQMAGLQKSVDELTHLVARMNESADQIGSMLRRREDQLKRAEAEIRKLRRKYEPDDPEPSTTGADNAGTVGGPSATPPPPGKGPSPRASTKASSDEDSPESADQGQEDSSSNEATAPRPRPRSRGGRRLPPEHLPEDIENHRVCACDHCGKAVLQRDVLSTSVYTVVESYVRRRTIRRGRAICKSCHRPTTAPMPPMPCERALYDCSFLAWLVVMKFVLLMPLDRIRTHLLSQGVDLAEGTLVHLIERAADLAAPIDGEHLRQLKSGTWMAFDGTGLKTLIVGQAKAWDGYLEVYTRDHLTVFQFDLTKHADRLRLRLNGFEGILECDAESRNAAAAPPGMTFSNCNAHPRRAFREAERAQPKLAVQGARFIQALYELEDEADEQGLIGERRVAFRQRRSRRVLYRFRQWLEGVVARLPLPSDPVRKVARYYLKHFEDLTRFVDHGELPLDNNSAERDFQRHAKLRHASLFAGSPEGGHRWATLLGVVRTAQKCDQDVQAYLTWMFERRGTHRHAFGMSAAELTPMAYRDRFARSLLAA